MDVKDIEMSPPGGRISVAHQTSQTVGGGIHSTEFFSFQIALY